MIRIAVPGCGYVNGQAIIRPAGATPVLAKDALKSIAVARVVAVKEIT